MASPDTDPAEVDRINALLTELRPSLKPLIMKAIQIISDSRAALILARTDPFQAGYGLTVNAIGIDGLWRHFKITGGNAEDADNVTAIYQNLIVKISRLPLDQIAIDYATFCSTDPGNAFKSDGSPGKVPAATDIPSQKMFFNPIYRRYDKSISYPFEGFYDVILKSIQVHEMCHAYFSMDDGDPSRSTAAQCLKLAQGFGNFLTQISLNQPFPL